MAGDRVFVAADETRMRETLASVLREDAAGYVVIARGTTQACLLELETVRPQIAVIDMSPIAYRRRTVLVRQFQGTLAAREMGLLLVLDARSVFEAGRLMQLGVHGVVLQDELSVEGLRARVRLVLRLLREDRDSSLIYGGFKLHLGTRRVQCGETNEQLGRGLFDSFWRLLAAKGGVVSYHSLLGYTEDPPKEQCRRAAKSRVYRLRRRLGLSGARIESVPGVGYRIPR